MMAKHASGECSISSCDHDQPMNGGSFVRIARGALNPQLRVRTLDRAVAIFHGSHDTNRIAGFDIPPDHPPRLLV